MTISETSNIMQAALMAGIKVASPILLVSILIGMLVAVLQAATQIHEQSLTFVPKLLAIAFVILILGPWMAQTMTDFVFYIFDLVARLN